MAITDTARAQWEESFRSLAAFKEVHRHCHVPNRSGPLGKWVSHQRQQHRGGKLSPDQKARLDEIGFAWNVQDVANEELWENNFRSLCAFKEEHGHCDIRTTTSGPLGTWVKKQRQRHKEGKLSSDRETRLKEIGFAWNVQDAANKVAWEERFGELTAYKEAQGHCNVPYRYGQLGEWVTKQRARQRKLSKDRIRRLDGLGFDWAPGRRRRAAASRVSDHEGAGAKGGEGGAEGGVARGRRAMVRNRLRRNGEGEDDEDNGGAAPGREQVLSDDEGTSSGGLDEGGTERAEGKSPRKERGGKRKFCTPPGEGEPRKRRPKSQPSEKPGRSASGYVCGKASVQKTDALSERAARTRRTNMTFTPNEARWEEKYQLLVAFKKKHGNCNVSKRSGPLGTWVNNQRKKHRRGKLSTERAKRLEEIGFAWSVQNAANEEAWEKHFLSLRAFKEEHGNCDVLTRSGPLGAWVHKQRQQHKNERLSSDRVTRLKKIGFAWNVKDAANEEAWEERFWELAAYKEAQGHCNVPYRDGQLGEWVMTQRKRKREGKLSEDRIRRLDGLGFDWALERGRRAAASRVSDHEGAGAQGGEGGAEGGVARGRRAMGRNRPRRDGKGEEDEDNRGAAPGRGQVLSDNEGTSSGGLDEGGTERAEGKSPRKERGGKRKFRTPPGGGELRKRRPKSPPSKKAGRRGPSPRASASRYVGGEASVKKTDVLSERAAKTRPHLSRTERTCQRTKESCRSDVPEARHASRRGKRASATKKAGKRRGAPTGGGDRSEDDGGGGRLNTAAHSCRAERKTTGVLRLLEAAVVISSAGSGNSGGGSGVY